MDEIQQQMNFARDIAAHTISKHIDHANNVISMIAEGSKAQSLLALTQFQHLILSSQAGGCVPAFMLSSSVLNDYCTGKDKFNQDFAKLSLLAAYHYLSPTTSSIREAFLWALARFHEIEHRPCTHDDELRTFLTKNWSHKR